MLGVFSLQGGGMSKRELLFSLSKDSGDFKVDTFKAGGKGGQHQNKTDSGARITHLSSGCVATSRTDRSQKRNIKIAFRILINKPEFKSWVRIEAARRQGKLQNIEKKIEKSLEDHNLKVEYKEDGKWKEEQ